MIGIFHLVAHSARTGRGVGAIERSTRIKAEGSSLSIKIEAALLLGAMTWSFVRVVVAIF